MRIIGRGLTVFALCVAIGLHWIALQSFAWTTMIVANARQASLAEAVARTFDGTHPCDLCKRINAAQQSSKKPEVQPARAKPDLICAARVVRIAPPAQALDFAPPAVHFHFRIESPPVPPPRPAIA